MREHFDKTTPPSPEDSAFEFSGNWGAFGKIALTNILLTIVTLGIYRFWATTRERKYLWSETRFIDDRLEWTGTGLELLIGFVLVILLFIIPLFIIQFVQQALLLQGQEGAAAALTFVMLGLIFYLGGLARYRALRYRLARTYWHGIRGGSDDQGFSYGWSYMWKTAIGYMILGLLIPWSMMSLWNERWGRMSFGQHQFSAIGDYADTFKRYLLFYLAPFIFFAGAVIIGIMTAAVDSPAMAGISIILLVLFFYLGLGLIAMTFYAKFYRVAIDGLSLHKLDFGFSAKTKDWFILLLGDAGIWLIAALAVALPAITIIGTSSLLGGFEMPQPGEDPGQLYLALLVPILVFAVIPFMLVGPFIRYRHWRFFITYMQCYGEIDLEELTQSDTSTSKHGEGLLDAFDIGAI
ncbi:YjgN family protein [Sphingorhabdus sp. Alg239-R122]|uniref:YjgN family protein n=1 Tax=Sphingorhabdus sp. Alg239-R122 TaxID=2305989 RepID=UPI0013DC44D1|nr:YjgN family protein [Sphingorhabdus sp. Alg239-R122]